MASETNNTCLIEGIQKYYVEILERKPTMEEIQSQIKWMSINNIKLEQLPLFLKESIEYSSLKNFKEIKGGPIKTNEGIIMHLNPNDQVISRYIAFYKEWEPFETLILKKLLKKDSKFIDIGSNIGYYSLLAASIAKEGIVISFEPETKNFEILRQNIITNNFQNIIPYKFAVSNKNGEVDLYLNNENNAGDHRIFDYDILGEGKKRISEKIQSISLDDFLTNKRNLFDIIKMDIQGSEMLVLKGMKKIIQETQEITLLTEFWPQGISATGESPEQFLTSLENYGFDIYEINEKINQIKKKPNEQLLLENIGSPNIYVETTLLCLKNRQPIFT